MGGHSLWGFGWNSKQFLKYSEILWEKVESYHFHLRNIDKENDKFHLERAEIIINFKDKISA